MACITVGKENFEEVVLKANKPVLVDFWADWCGPCKMLSPIVEEVSEMRDDFIFCKINVDEENELAVEYKVMSIPMLLIFKNGEIVNKSIGAISKSELWEFLDNK